MGGPLPPGSSPLEQRQQQPAGWEQGGLKVTTTSIPPSKASAAAKSVLDDMPITDKLATSIASKLSGAELKGIIGMTEKLRKLEAVLMQMQTENEDVRARWQVCMYVGRGMCWTALWGLLTSGSGCMYVSSAGAGGILGNGECKGLSDG